MGSGAGRARPSGFGSGIAVSGRRSGGEIARELILVLQPC